MKKICKTKKCNWCKKRKKIEKGYLLRDIYDKKIQFFICDNCNLIHDAV